MVYDINIEGSTVTGVRQGSCINWSGARILYASLQKDVISWPKAVPDPLANIHCCCVVSTHPKLPLLSHTLSSNAMIVGIVNASNVASMGHRKLAP